MKILLSALEASANLHASHVLNELRKHENIELCGIYELKGENEPLLKSSEFSAMGFLGVLHLIKKAKKAIKSMCELARGVDAVLLIDSPAFNIPLAKALKKAKISAKVSYYILPQVWAWKEYRAKIVRANCDNLLSILPFEEKFYENSVFVGHPLLDEIKIGSNNFWNSKNLVFMPGSRKGEINALMPVFKDFALLLGQKGFGDFNKQIVVPPHFRGKENEIYGDTSDFSFVYDANEALFGAKFAFICSGTATLQAALIGTPFVLCYKARAFDVWLARHFVKNLRHIGLANIIFDFMGENELHKELIQNEVSPNALMEAFLSASEFEQKSQKLREYLKSAASANVAKIILNGAKK